MRQDPRPAEDFCLWAGIQRPDPIDTDELRELVSQLVQMTTQKTAGQRRDKPGDLPWDNYERVKMALLCSAVCLVQSGQLDRLEGRIP